jgi:hypothetical protein
MSREMVACVASNPLQTAPHLLLAVERLEIDEFQDDGLASCFHNGKGAVTRIHDLRRIGAIVFIVFS